MHVLMDPKSHTVTQHTKQSILKLQAASDQLNPAAEASSCLQLRAVKTETVVLMHAERHASQQLRDHQLQYKTQIRTGLAATGPYPFNSAAEAYTCLWLKSQGTSKLVRVCRACRCALLVSSTVKGAVSHPQAAGGISIHKG